MTSASKKSACVKTPILSETSEEMFKVGIKTPTTGVLPPPNPPMQFPCGATFCATDSPFLITGCTVPQPEVVIYSDLGPQSPIPRSQSSFSHTVQVMGSSAQGTNRHLCLHHVGATWHYRLQISFALFEICVVCFSETKKNHKNRIVV